MDNVEIVVLGREVEKGKKDSKSFGTYWQKR